MGSNFKQQTSIKMAKQMIACTYEIVQFCDPLWTEPIGMDNRRKFLNTMAVVRTVRSKLQVECSMKYIQTRCKRKRSRKARGVIDMDLDLMYYDGEMFHTDDLQRDYMKQLMAQAEEMIPEIEKIETW